MIAFALNYIPFIGPFVATLFPTLVAMTQFESWEAVVGVFVCLNIIQFVVGSYIEPRVSGAMLAMSPTVVLLAVFLWTYLWGLFGAFIGVPIVIAIVTFCAYHPSSRWIADLLGGPMEREGFGGELGRVVVIVIARKRERSSAGEPRSVSRPARSAIAPTRPVRCEVQSTLIVRALRGGEVNARRLHQRQAPIWARPKRVNIKMRGLGIRRHHR